MTTKEPPSAAEIALAVERDLRAKLLRYSLEKDDSGAARLNRRGLDFLLHACPSFPARESSEVDAAYEAGEKLENGPFLGFTGLVRALETLSGSHTSADGGKAFGLMLSTQLVPRCFVPLRSAYRSDKKALSEAMARTGAQVALALVTSAFSKDEVVVELPHRPAPEASSAPSSRSSSPALGRSRSSSMAVEDRGEDEGDGGERGGRGEVEEDGYVRDVKGFLEAIGCEEDIGYVRDAGVLSLSDVKNLEKDPTLLLSTGISRSAARKIIRATAAIGPQGYDPSAPTPRIKLPGDDLKLDENHEPTRTKPSATSGGDDGVAKGAAFQAALSAPSFGRGDESERVSSGEGKDRTATAPHATSTSPPKPPPSSSSSSTPFLPSSSAAVSSPSIPSPSSGPVDWEEFTDKDGYVYYYHRPTGQSQWARPLGQRVLTIAAKQFRKLPSSPGARSAAHSSSPSVVPSAAMVGESFSAARAEARKLLTMVEKEFKARGLSAPKRRAPRKPVSKSRGRASRRSSPSSPRYRSPHATSSSSSSSTTRTTTRAPPSRSFEEENVDGGVVGWEGKEDKWEDGLRSEMGDLSGYDNGAGRGGLASVASSISSEANFGRSLPLPPRRDPTMEPTARRYRAAWESLVGIDLEAAEEQLPGRQPKRPEWSSVWSAKDRSNPLSSSLAAPPPPPPESGDVYEEEEDRESVLAVGYAARAAWHLREDEEELEAEHLRSRGVRRAASPPRGGGSMAPSRSPSVASRQRRRGRPTRRSPGSTAHSTMSLRSRTRRRDVGYGYGRGGGGVSASSSAASASWIGAPKRASRSVSPTGYRRAPGGYIRPVDEDGDERRVEGRVGRGKRLFQAVLADGDLEDEDGVTAEDVARVRAEFPLADDRSAHVIAKASRVAAGRITSYANPRPGPHIGAWVRRPQGGRDLSAGPLAVDFDRSTDRLTRDFAASLRPNLYYGAEYDQLQTPRTSHSSSRTRSGRSRKARSVSPSRFSRFDSRFHRNTPSGRTAPRLLGEGGEQRAPSETTTGYAFRHASAMAALDTHSSVFDRLLDPRGFTGTHRERFRPDGSGRGLAGRDGGTDYEAIRAAHFGRGSGPSSPDDTHGDEPFNAPIPGIHVDFKLPKASNKGTAPARA